MNNDNNKTKNTDEQFVDVIADILVDSSMTPEKLKSLLDLACKKADKTKADSGKDPDSDVVDIVKYITKSKNSRVVLAATETNEGKVDKMVACCHGKGESCLALMGVLLMSVLDEQKIDLKDFCDGMITAQKRAKKMKCEEN